MNSKNETHPAEFVMGMYMLADIDDKKLLLSQIWLMIKINSS